MKDISNPLLRPLFQYQPQPHDPSNIIELDSRNGAATITEGSNTLSATGTVTSGAGTITGTANITEAAQTVTGAGTVLVAGTASITEAAQTVTGAGTHPVIGTASITEAAHTLTGAGAVLVTGTASITEAANTVTASGTVAAAGTITGTAEITEGADSVSGEGVVVALQVPSSEGARGGGGSSAVRMGSAKLRDGKAIDDTVDRILARMTAPPEVATPAAVKRVASAIRAEPEAPKVTLAQVEASMRRVLAEMAAIEAANDDEEAAFMLLVA